MNDDLLTRSLRTDNVRSMKRKRPRLTLGERWYLFWLWAVEVAPAGWTLAILITLIVFCILYLRTEYLASQALRLVLP